MTALLDHPPSDVEARPQFGHRPGLDGLRSISVMVVVAFHTGMLQGGWVGVDLFFALSGWLITGILIAEIDQRGSLRLGAFWRRRVRRLLPAVGVLLAVVVVLRAFGWIELRQRGVIGAFTYSTNWVNIFGGSGYWDQFAAPDPLEHLWSLAVEEQIYVVWPLVMLAIVAMRGRGRAVRGAGIAIAAASAAAAVYGSHAGWSIDRLYQGTDTRAFAFAVGAGAAGLSLRRLGNVVNHLIVAAAMVGIVWIGWSGAAQPTMFRGPMQSISLLGLLAVVASAGITAGPLCWRVPRRLGMWSYGIYLFHWPLAVAFEGKYSNRVWFLLVAVLSTALAGASYWLVEQRVRRDGLPGRRLPLALAGGVAVVAAALSLTTAVVPAGAQPEATLPSLLPRPTTEPNQEQNPDNPQTTIAAPKRILIVGDSVPSLAATAVVAAGAERGLAVGVVAKPGCVGSPYADDQYDKGECGPFIDSLAAQIADADPDAIIFWWGGTGEGVSWDGKPTMTCSAEGPAAITGRLEWLLSLAGDIPSSFVAPVPRTDLDADAAAGTECELDVYAAVAESTGAPLLRLDALVCPDYPDDCDRVERYDGLHYTPAAANEVGGWIFDQLADALAAISTDPAEPAEPSSAIVSNGAGGGGTGAATGDAAVPNAPALEVERILVLGDSTADVMAKGLASTGRLEVVNASVWGCPFVVTNAVRFEIGRRRTTDYCPSTLDKAQWIRQWKPDVVLLVNGPSGQWDQQYADKSWSSPGDEKWISHHDDEMRSLVAAAGDIPIVSVLAPQAMRAGDDALESGDRLAAWNDQIHRWDALFPSVTEFAIDDYLPKPGSAEDRKVRPDGVHVTAEVMAQLAGDHLVDDVIAAARRATADIAAAN
jgi:peptidoglycan/LPS O-acetylase OafA/YrhL